MSLFRKSRSKSDLQQEYQCTIRFLDDSEPIHVPFTKDTVGQVVLDKVCSTLNLLEKDYFGLRYVDAEKQRHWLDPVKTVYRQLKGVSPCVLCFRVKFYPADPMHLHEEITRYYLFLQLRRDLHHGRLLCSPQDANLLAAFIIQSEVGDYDPQDHPPGYVAEFKMLPKQNIKMEEQIMELHKTLAGQVPAEAEANFLKKAATLDTYGVDPHQVKDQKGTQLYLGVTHQGIMTFHGSRRTQIYKWTQIKKLAFEGKMFIIHVSINEDEDQPHSKKKHQPVGYKCLTAAACKYLWRCAVEQQFFFTLSDSHNPPKMRSGGSLFSRGSKFRFSGRCQNEAYQASDSIKRQEPDFQRTCSLPNFARNLGNKSLEEKARALSQNTSPSIREEAPTQNTNPISIEPSAKSVKAEKEVRELPKEMPIKPLRSAHVEQEVPITREKPSPEQKAKTKPFDASTKDRFGEVEIRQEFKAPLEVLPTATRPAANNMDTRTKSVYADRKLPEIPKVVPVKPSRTSIRKESPRPKTFEKPLIEPESNSKPLSDQDEDPNAPFDLQQYWKTTAAMSRATEIAESPTKHVTSITIEPPAISIHAERGAEERLAHGIEVQNLAKEVPSERTAEERHVKDFTDEATAKWDTEERPADGMEVKDYANKAPELDIEDRPAQGFADEVSAEWDTRARLAHDIRVQNLANEIPAERFAVERSAQDFAEEASAESDTRERPAYDIGVQNFANGVPLEREAEERSAQDFADDAPAELDTEERPAPGFEAQDVSDEEYEDSVEVEGRERPGQDFANDASAELDTEERPACGFEAQEVSDEEYEHSVEVEGRERPGQDFADDASVELDPQERPGHGVEVQGVANEASAEIEAGERPVQDFANEASARWNTEERPTYDIKVQDFANKVSAEVDLQERPAHGIEVQDFTNEVPSEMDAGERPVRDLYDEPPLEPAADVQVKSVVEPAPEVMTGDLPRQWKVSYDQDISFEREDAELSWGIGIEQNAPIAQAESDDELSLGTRSFYVSPARNFQPQQESSLAPGDSDDERNPDTPSWSFQGTPEESEDEQTSVTFPQSWSADVEHKVPITQDESDHTEVEISISQKNFDDMDREILCQQGESDYAEMEMSLPKEESDDSDDSEDSSSQEESDDDERESSVSKEDSDYYDREVPFTQKSSDDDEPTPETVYGEDERPTTSGEPVHEPVTETTLLDALAKDQYDEVEAHQLSEAPVDPFPMAAEPSEPPTKPVYAEREVKEREWPELAKKVPTKPPRSLQAGQEEPVPGPDLVPEAEVELEPMPFFTAADYQCDQVEVQEAFKAPISDVLPGATKPEEPPTISLATELQDSLPAMSVGPLESIPVEQDVSPTEEPVPDLIPETNGLDGLAGDPVPHVQVEEEYQALMDLLRVQKESTEPPTKHTTPVTVETPTKPVYAEREVKAREVRELPVEVRELPVEVPTEWAPSNIGRDVKIRQEIEVTHEKSVPEPKPDITSFDTPATDQYREVEMRQEFTAAAEDMLPVATKPAENAVDVSGLAELSQSPVVKAPVAGGQKPVIEEIQFEQVGQVASPNPAMVYQNGTIPIIVTPAGDSPSEDTSVSLSYQPEESVYDADDDARAAKSLEDQVLELEKEYERVQELNHVTPAVEETVLPSKSGKVESSLPNSTSKPASKSPEKSRCSCCKVVTYTFFSVFLTLTVALVAVMFSDIQHPVADQLREHLHFMDPVRDYIQDQYQAVFQKS